MPVSYYTQSSSTFNESVYASVLCMLIDLISPIYTLEAGLVPYIKHLEMQVQQT